jgi:MFS family permease
VTTLRARLVTQYGRNTLLIAIAEVLLSAAFLGIYQLLIGLYALRLGYGAEFIGVMWACEALTFSLMSVLGALLGRRFGSRITMLAGAVAAVIGMALLPLAEAVPAGVQSWWLILARMLAGGGWATLMVNEIPALANYCTAENRPHAYALRQGASGLGMLLGTLVGSLLPSAFAQLLGRTMDKPAPYGYGLSTCIVIGMAGIWPLTRLGIPEKRLVERPSDSPVATSSRNSARPAVAPFAGLMVAAFLNHSALASGKVFYSAYMDQHFGLATSLIGLVASAGMLLATVAALGSARLTSERSSGGVMLLASLGLACSLLLMASGHWLTVSLGVVGILALPAIWLPAYQSLQMEITPASERVLVAGLCSMAMSLGFGSTSLGGGYVVSGLGYSRLFLMGGSAAALSAALMWSLMRRRIFVKRG